jgi:O-6-methylguanine DNA methyltransferase
VAVAHVAYEAEGWGVGELWLEDRMVVWHELPRPRIDVEPAAGDFGASAQPSQSPTRPRGKGNVHTRGSQRSDDLATIVVGAIRSYFAGDARALDDVPVDLEYASEFHERCARALRDVPAGSVVTYGELASLAGAPGAARAAGTFCARNRLGLFVPCHRVVGADGLGSYGSLGLGYKRRLLELEGAL